MYPRLDTSRTLTSRLSYAASVVMLLAYGVLPNGPNDPDIEAVNDCLYRLGINMRPGVWMVDYWPLLRYASPSISFGSNCPLNNFRYIPGYLKELQDGHAKELNLFKRKLFEVRDRLVRFGSDCHSYLYSWYARRGGKKLQTALVNIFSSARGSLNCLMVKRVISLGACSAPDRTQPRLQLALLSWRRRVTQTRNTGFRRNWIRSSEVVVRTFYL